MIKTIHEHKVNTSLLPDKAIIMDIGCRGLLLTDHFRRRGHKVYAVDIDELDRPKDYERIGIANYHGLIGVEKTRDPQATHTKVGNDVECTTLHRYMQYHEIEMFDLIKIDVEGDERAIIKSLEVAPAKQISIEFHLHLNNYNLEDVEKIVNKLHKLGYKTASHELTNEHGAGLNYWSSLFILEE
jgi:hypothetical protein